LKFLAHESLRAADGLPSRRTLLRAPERAIFCLSFILWLLWVEPMAAHLSPFAAATVSIEPDGQYALDLTFDLPAFALDELPQNTPDAAMNQLLDGPVEVLSNRLQEAEARFERQYYAVANGLTGSVSRVIFPTAADIQRYKESAPAIRLPVMLMLSLEGHLPAGARAVSFRFPPKLGTVALTVMRPDQAPGVLVANPGEPSPVLPIQLSETNSVNAVVSGSLVEEPSRWQLAGRYLVLGFEHILPRGLDHILFVLGLYLLGNRLRPLLLQVTAFTVAHSLTLGLSLYGVLHLSPRIVEPLIALSIAFVAVENLCTSELKPWRPFVVFCFGLMHGMGFAGVLTSLGLPRREFATALLTFNAGVEMGQLTVISLAFLAIGWFRHRSWYRRGVVIPLSGAIAATGLFWTVQRILQK